MNKKTGVIIVLAAAVAILAVALILIFTKKDDESNDSISSDRYVDIPSADGNSTSASSGSNSTGTQKNETTTETVNYSGELDTYGLIKDVKATDYIHINTIEGIKVSKSSITPSEEDVLAEVELWKENFDSTYNTQEGIEALEGDKINFDFKGYVDDVAFSGGDTAGNGYDYTIGSKQFIDTFDEQLVGHKIGEKFDVFVTFPDPYPNDTTLSGKLARFECVINGIYQSVEFTDEFVAENLSEYATNYEEFVEFVRNYLFENNLSECVYTSFIDGCVVTEYPEAYLEQNKKMVNQNYTQKWQYYNYYYSLYYGFEPWSSIYDYMGLDEEAYNAKILEDAQYLVLTSLAKQVVYEKMGKPEMTEEDIRECMKENGLSDDKFAQAIEVYGYPFWYQQVISMKAVQYLIDNVEYVD